MQPLLTLPPPPSLTLPQRKALWLEKARTTVDGYTLHCQRGYKMGRFHAFVSQKLNLVSEGKLKRLIITVPPRHGKTMLAAENFIPMMMGKRPGIEIVYSSYNGDRAGDVARKIRDRLRSEEHAELFPENRCRTDQTKLEDFATIDGSCLRSVGVDGSLTGRGFDLGIIDDPHKNRAEAESPIRRQKIWDWFSSTFTTRESPDAAIIIIMTRWHKDDLAGRLQDPKYMEELKELGFPEEQWTVINLPAIAEKNDPLNRAEGEALDPGRWPLRKLLSKKARMAAYDWNALYCGKPRAKGGNYVDVTKIIRVLPDQLPKRLRPFRFWDLATTKKQMSDYCAGAKVALTYDKHTKDWILWILHINWFKAEWPEQRRRINQQAALDEGTIIGVEAVGGFRTAYFDLRDDLAGSVVVREYTPDTDKLTRALPWFSLVEKGNVRMLVGAWNQPFLDELEQFPTGDHDDQVDSISGGYHMAVKGMQGILLA